MKALKENEKYKNIPVVIITTSTNPTELDHCMELGAVGIFHKPNSIPELCNGLERILMN